MDDVEEKDIGARAGAPMRTGRPRKERPEGVVDQFTPKSPLTAQLGALLRSARVERCISLKRMAGLMECSINALRMYESGGTTMRVETLLRAAEILSIEPAALIAIDPSLLPDLQDQAAA